MKLNKIFFAAALCLGIISCQEEAEWTPAPEVSADAQEVYFENPDELGCEIDPADNVTSHEVVVLRAADKAAEALTIGINVIQNDSNKFTVPESVTFEAGAVKATFAIGFEGLQVAETYTLHLALDPAAINPYDTLACNASYSFSVTPIKWELGKGIYVDELISSYASGVLVHPWYVDYKFTTLPSGNKRLVILSPFGMTPAGKDVVADENGIYDAWAYFSMVDPAGATDFTINIDTENAATLARSYTGVDLGYGNIFGASLVDKAGVYTPGASVIFNVADQAIANGDDEGAYTYAGLQFYFTVDAYLEATAVEGSGCEIADFEGQFVLSSFDIFSEATEPQQDSVAIAYFADYEMYLIEGLPGLSYAGATFDEKAQLMHIPAQEGDSISLGGVDYGTVVYGLDAENQISTDDLIFIANEDGSITLHETSASVGYVILLTQDGNLVEDAEGYLAVMAGYQIKGFAPVAAPAEAPAIHKVPAFKQVSTLNNGKKFKRVPSLLNVSNLFIK